MYVYSVNTETCDALYTNSKYSQILLEIIRKIYLNKEIDIKFDLKVLWREIPL